METLIDKFHKGVPAYSPRMYLDGYKPYEIMQAHRQMMRDSLEDTQDQREAMEPIQIRIASEVKVK